MGIHGIYKEIGPGKRIALSKFSVEHYVQHSRPLRLAIDISIWLFQIQSGKGGSNPALRTFYYRLLRLLSLNIHPLFVFDGPNKPPFKRNKRVGGPHVKVSSIPEFLAKQLLKQFGFPMHAAPGEAEAECALLQREGIVDAVLSEDVDTLMFGSGLTMRSWTPEMKSSKVPTHVNVYDAKVTKDGSGLDRDGMVLIALMSGGDYIPEGIPGCGPKTACEAARAGFGAELCKIKKNDDLGFREWRERLQHELYTNESKLFKQKHKALSIPDDFPNREALGYYTHPCISGPEKLAKLRDTLKWDTPLDFASLRSFAADAFDWRCLGGAKKFVRNLAPALLIRELRLRAERGDSDRQSLGSQDTSETRLISAIHGKRNHATTDNMLELRMSFVPMNVVDIYLSIEEPDEDMAVQDEESDSEAPAVQVEEDGCATSPKKTRGPSQYDPTVPEKIWMVDTWLRLGAPLKVQNWEASTRNQKQLLDAKSAAKEAEKVARARKKTNKGSVDTQPGALDRFTKVTKPGISSQQAGTKLAALDKVDSTRLHDYAQRRFQLPSSQPLPLTKEDFYTPSSIEEVDLSIVVEHEPRRQSKRRSPEAALPSQIFKSYRVASPKSKMPTVISLLSSPEVSSRMPRAVTPKVVSESIFNPELLPDTVTKRRKRSPFKRHHTAPDLGLDSSWPTPNSLRSLTPTLMDTVEPIDLVSAVPSPATLIGTPSKSRTEVMDLDTTPRVMRAVDIASPSAKPCRDIPEWIRRSQSITPAKARHSNFLQPRDNNAEKSKPISLDLPTSDGEEEVDRPGVSAFLPVMRRYRERVSPTKFTMPNVAIEKTTETSARPKKVPTRHSPRLERSKAPVHGDAQPRPKTLGTKAGKRHIKLRESLEGAWKEVDAEHVNLTGAPLPMMTTKRATTTRWRKSEIEVLDLTED